MQDDVERDIEHRVVGAHVLSDAPAIDVATGRARDDLPVIADAVRSELRQQQLALAPMARAVQHPQRARAGKTGERLFVEGIVPAGILGEHLTRAFRRQGQDELSTVDLHCYELAVAAAQPGIERPGIAEEEPHARRDEPWSGREGGT